MKDDRHLQSGNVLYYVLVGIVLFAALNMAFVQTQRTGGSTPDNERLALHASEIMQYTSGLQRAVRMMRIDGLEYTELSFKNNIVTAGYTHATEEPDSHKLFHVSGGGMAYQRPVDDWLDTAQSAGTFYGEWYFPGELCIKNVGSDTLGTCLAANKPNQDVVIILPWIKKQLCTVINERLEITGIPQETSHGWNADNRKFVGDEGNGEILEQGGKRMGCFEGNGANTPPVGTYHYFHVLWAR